MEKEQPKKEQPNLEEIKRRFNISEEYKYNKVTEDSPEKNLRFLIYLDSLKRSKKVTPKNYDIFKTAFHPNPEMIEVVPEPTEEELKEIEAVRENIQKMMNPEPEPEPEPEPKKKRRPRRTKKQMEAARTKEAKEAKEAKDN